MIYRAIHNPSHTTVKQCLRYMMRADQPERVHYSLKNFGAGADLQRAVEASQALAPLAEEHGHTPRPSLRPFRHAILSLAADEDLKDDEMVEISHEVCDGLGRKIKPLPKQPTVVAVHRDTDNVHTHILTVPVDIATGKRVRLPEAVAAYRSVLEPIEKRLGLSSVKADGWNSKRYYLPFRTWVKMHREREAEVRTALIHSSTWEQAMKRLSRVGIRFTPTDFADTKSHYLHPLGARKRDGGMSIAKDVFPERKVTATEMTSRWGEFPEELQRRIEAAAKPAPEHRYRKCAIGSDRGELLLRRWRDYRRAKDEQREQLSGLLERALTTAQNKSAADRSEDDLIVLANPGRARERIRYLSTPMEFSHWIEHSADAGDAEAQWLSEWGNKGANADPKLALQCAIEGALDESADVRDERTRELRREFQERKRSEQELEERRAMLARRDDSRRRIGPVTRTVTRRGAPPPGVLRKFSARPAGASL